MNNEQAICGKAPAGGMTSVVNGQFYEGGEFMPIHGKSNAAKPARQYVSRDTGKPVFGEGRKMFGVFSVSGSLQFQVWADDINTAKRIASENGAGQWDEVLKN